MSCRGSERETGHSEYYSPSCSWRRMAEGGCQIDWIQSYSINRHTITALACLSPPSVYPSIHPVQWLWTSSWINNCSLAVSWGSLLWIPIRYYIRTATHSGSQVTHLMHGIVVKLNLRHTQPFSGSPMGAQLTSRRRRLEAVVEWTPRRNETSEPYKWREAATDQQHWRGLQQCGSDRLDYPRKVRKRIPFRERKKESPLRLTNALAARGRQTESNRSWFGIPFRSLILEGLSFIWMLFHILNLISCSNRLTAGMGREWRRGEIRMDLTVIYCSAERSFANRRRDWNWKLLLVFVLCFCYWWRWYPILASPSVIRSIDSSVCCSRECVMAMNALNVAAELYP